MYVYSTLNATVRTEIRDRDALVPLSWFLYRDQPIGPTSVTNVLFTPTESDCENESLPVFFPVYHVEKREI